MRQLYFFLTSFVTTSTIVYLPSDSVSDGGGESTPLLCGRKVDRRRTVLSVF